MNEFPFVASSLEERHPISMSNGVLQNVTQRSVFELIRDIRDPEHPYTLEQLGVVSREGVSIGCIGPDGIAPNVGLPIRCVKVVFKPTIPHCSMAAVIGLCIKTHVSRHVRNHFVQVHIVDGGHINFRALNKQLDDKDRVLAATENEVLLDLMEKCLPAI
ncbi:similarity to HYPOTHETICAL PROTEIN YHS2_YEAST [Encephalitozoon cuniculi GB-M1]|uniref:Uncharacterized protein n=2 Tax=Encephalitozoon cuniculi TaxID=6035 RepID=Q8SUC6_ENCCU|nr:iron-sulfur cluster assembly protein CIA2 [Encephalitozoon cuniculi GB-M1]AGE96185.1 hypothetical protein ECU10_1290 [Encephalitozoon cuniculi]KMV65281.1 hypothetical protein M970_101220 [Encephalitozoon cuniculi EcunIII-L]UYI26591.1 MIP18-like protein [Encephalitozoon cuniculi]CAD25848.1 similarity to HYPOTHETICAL PROTEIN YHS2_YEAST [Encephalitozoon cuniculi GB-M1]